MLYRIFSAFLAFFIRRVSHLKCRLIRHILAEIMNIYSDLGGRLIFRSSYTCIYTVFAWSSTKTSKIYVYFFVVNCLSPSYVTDMLHRKPLHTRNTRSSSYTMPLLNRPAHSKATLGDRSFFFASLSVWNSLQMMSGVPHLCHHISLV